MSDTQIQLLLADDDPDDCLLFSEALNELSASIQLSIVNDGVELLQFLSKPHGEIQTDVIFLDLNMPRKNGYECLAEIRQDGQFDPIPIIIFSTSFDPATADKLCESGANFYIRKPADFSLLKKVLSRVITLIQSGKAGNENKDNFILLS